MVQNLLLIKYSLFLENDAGIGRGGTYHFLELASHFTKRAREEEKIVCYTLEACNRLWVSL